MITMTEIARLAHVSQPTVSRVLNGSRTVAPEIRERVLACAREHDYQCNALAKGLQGNQTKLLGVLVAGISNPAFAGLIQAIEAAARKGGYSILLLNSNCNPKHELEYLDIARRYRVDGVLAVPIRETSGLWQEFAKKLDVPVVSVGRKAEGLDSVYADHAAAGSLVAEHLVAQGFQRFLFLGREDDERYTGFQRTLSRLECGTQTACLAYQDGQLEQALQAWLFQSQERPGVFASSDLCALRVLSALRERNVSVPEEAGVIGFGANPMGRYLSPGLSSVSPPTAQMAQEAVTRLLERIGHPGPQEAQDLPLSASLVIRGSTSRLS